MSGFDVLCVGSVTLDSIALVERKPDDDERVEASLIVESGGGPAATAAVALARLGARVAFCGTVGEDPDGERSRGLLESEGVDTRWLRVQSGVRTARSLISVTASTGTRSITTVPGAPPLLENVPLGEFGWIHTDQTGFGPVRAALCSIESGQPKGSSAKVSLDAGNRIAGLDVGIVDLYVPTAGRIVEDFPAESLADSMAAAEAAGAGRVVATAGGSGAYLHNEGGSELIPGMSVPIVSTMGAGDVFHGALLARILEDRPLREAVVFANAVAALSCRALDGRSGIPSREEAERFMNSYLADRTWRREENLERETT